MAASIARAYGARGGVYNSRIDPDRAIADFTKALEIDPTSAGYYVDLGVAYTNRNGSGDQDRAIAVLDQACAIEIEKSGKPAAYTMLRRSVAYFIKGDFVQAIADCNQAIELDQIRFVLWSARNGLFGNGRLPTGHSGFYQGH